MARDITALGALSTRTFTRPGAITGSEDQFSLPSRNVLRATDWYTFTLAFVATSLTVSSTPRPQSHDMVGWLYAGTITPTSDIADLGSPIEFNDDGGTNLNFQISRTNLAVGDYTIAAQRHTAHNAAYGLKVVAVVPGAPTVPTAPSAPSVRAASSTALAVSWVAPNDGGSALTDYDVRYKKSADSVWKTWPFSGLGLVTTITGLTAETGYDVQVRAHSIAGAGRWSASWSGATPRAPAPAAVLTVQIDWGNDGTFGHPAADVTSDMVKDSLRTTRGRTLQSRRKAVAGRLECKLWNLNAKYDPINSSSPIYEKDISGLRIRAQLAGVTVWAGRIDTQRYRNRPVPQLDIIALGLLSTLRQPVSVAGQTAKSSGSIAKLVGAAVGIVTTYLNGNKVLDRWQAIADQDALITLHDLEEYEETFLYERADGDLAMDAKNARSTGDSAVSALTLKDEIEAAADIPLLEGSALDWGHRYIANTVRVPVKVLEAEAQIITLWSGSHVKVGAHVVFDILVGYPEDNQAPLSHRGVVTWIEPVAGTDFTAQTGLRITGAVSGDGYLLTFSNSTNTVINVGPLKVRGTPLVVGDTAYIPSRDTDSITAFGEREYARPSPLFTDIGQAQAYADGIVGRLKSPHGWLVARWPAYYAVALAQALELSRRITVERLGATQDYYIEAIGIVQRGFVRMEYLLSPIPGAGVPSTPLVSVAKVPGNYSTQLAVSWSEPFNGGLPLTDYNIRYRELGTGTWLEWMHTGTGRTATLTGLTAPTVYEVQVQAVNMAGDSVWATSGTEATATAPGAPALVSVAKVPGNYSTQLAVSWSEPFNGGLPLTDYNIRYRELGTGTWLEWMHTGTGRTATLTGLTAPTVYEVQVQAVNMAGDSVWATSGTEATATAPGAPRLGSLRVIDLTFGQGTIYASVRWRTPVVTGGLPGEGYILQIRSRQNYSSDAWTVGTSAIRTGLTAQVHKAGNEVQARVQAVNAAGAGPWSPWSNTVRLPYYP